MRSVGSPVAPGADFAFARMLRERRRPVTLGELRRTGANGPELSDAACVLAMRRVLAIDLRAERPEDCRVSLPVQEAA